MAMTDIAWNPDSLDVQVDPETNDLRLVSDNALIAQNLTRSMQILKGHLPWDPDAGSNVPHFLNDTVSRAQMKNELIRICKAMPEITSFSVSDGGDFFHIAFVSGDGSETLEVAI